MACKCVCPLCDKLRVSTAVNLVDGNIVIDLPAGSYNNCGKYCVIISQNIPAGATVESEVFFTIGGGTVQYPFVDRCCRPVTRCQIGTRKRYSMRVETTPTGGTFKALCNLRCCVPTNNLTAIDGTAPAAPAAPAT